MLDRTKILCYNIFSLKPYSHNVYPTAINDFNINSQYVTTSGNSINIHTEGKWLDTDWPSFFVLSTESFELVNWGISVYKGSLYFDNNEEHSLYNASLNFSAYAGFNFEKSKYGVELGGSVGRLGYDGKFIDIYVDFLNAKFLFIYEDGKLKIDPGFGWVDLGISINIVAIIDYLKGAG